MPVTGASPVTFISESTAAGKQYQIPLAQIAINNGTIDVKTWIDSVKLTGSDKDTLVPNLLLSLLQQGLIT